MTVLEHQASPSTIILTNVILKYPNYHCLQPLSSSLSITPSHHHPQLPYIIPNYHTSSPTTIHHHQVPWSSLTTIITSHHRNHVILNIIYFLLIKAFFYSVNAKKMKYKIKQCGIMFGWLYSRCSFIAHTLC